MEPEWEDNCAKLRLWLKTRPGWQVFGFLALIITGCWIGFGWILPRLLFSKQEDAGTFGDSFGMVNALFSGLAFLGVIVAIWLQNRELQHQLHEFAEQTKLQSLQLEQDRIAAEIQRKITDQQLELLREERNQRRVERELSLKPIFMLRVGKIEDKDQRRELFLHNGGSPVYDINIESSNHNVQLKHDSGVLTDYTEILDRYNPVELIVTKRGLSGPLNSGNITIQYVKADHSEGSAHFYWRAHSGLSASSKSPRTEVTYNEA